MASTKPNRAYPSLPASGPGLLEAVREAIEVHERRTRNKLDSFVRLGELVELGIVSIQGDQILAAEDTLEGGTLFDEAVQDLIGALLADSSEIDFTYTDSTPTLTAAFTGAFQHNLQLGEKSGTSAPTYYSLEMPNASGFSGWSSLIAHRNAGGNAASIFIGTAVPAGLSQPASPVSGASGTNNVGIGARALASLTSGRNNFGLGPSTLRLLTTTNNNTAIGFSSGEFVTGVDNVFMGENAGRGVSGNSAISSNVCIGSGAGEVLVTGGDANVYVGLDCGGNTSTGFQNTCVGFDAGLSIIGGDSNTCIGYSTGFFDGSENVAVGALVAVGSAGSLNQNTMIGTLAGENNAGSRNLFLGYNAGGNETGSDRLYVANTNTATPLIFGIFPNTQLTFNSALVEIQNAAPRLMIDETDAASNERIYDFASSAGQLLGRTRTDADGAGATWLTVDRTGTTVDSIVLAATAITLNGVAASDFARLSAANTFTNGNTVFQRDLNGAAKNILVNLNSGTAAYTSFNLYNDQNSGVRALEIDYSSSTWSGALVTGGPSGEQGAMGTTGAYPLTLYTNNTARFSISGAGVIDFYSVTTFSDGAVGAPGISFTSDTNTGLYRIGADNVGFAANGALKFDYNATRANFDVPVQLQNYTVATLPAGVQGYVAYVTDALAPAFLTAVVGGGAVVTPVFYDGTNWVAI